MVKAICLTKSNQGRRRGEFQTDIKLIDLCNSDLSKIHENIENLIPKKFISYKKKTISRECDYKYNDKTLSFYAWNNGRAGSENKHDLPPPIDKELYFGNIFVIAHNNNEIIDLTETEYDEFYENAFGGFEDLGSEDSWSEEEIVNSDDSINDFIVDDEEEDADYVPSEENEEEFNFEEESEEEFEESEEEEEEEEEEENEEEETESESDKSESLNKSNK